MSSLCGPTMEYFHFLIPDIIDGNIDAAHIS